MLSTKSDLADLPIFRSRWSQAALLLLIIAVCGATAWRTHKNWSPPAMEFNWELRGHSDFHNGLLQPSLAFRNGDSPYVMDVREKYQMCRPVPPFSPALFILHLPLTFPGLIPANIAFFVMNTLLLIGLGCLSVKLVDRAAQPGVWLLAVLLVLMSRPGHQTLFTGYFTAELAIGTVLALHFARTKPWLSAAGILLTSFKPNFVVPLLVLLIFRRDFQAVARGLVLCAIGALLGVAWLSIDSGPVEVIRGIIEGQKLHDANPTVEPGNTWVRIDLPGIASKPLDFKPDMKTYLLLMLPLMALPGLALWRIGKQGYTYGASGVSGLLICLTMLVTFYHSIYDSLILVAPWIAATFYGSRLMPELSSGIRWTLVLLTSIPAANYLATMSARTRLGLEEDSAAWQLLNMSSGLALFLALVILVVAVLRCQRYSSDNSQFARTLVEGS